MSDSLLPILQNPAVLERTSPATRRVLEERGQATASVNRFLPDGLYTLLQQITATLLPQQNIGTEADLAAEIDRKLQTNKGDGWRFADLPEDAEAYRKGLSVFAAMLQQTPAKDFASMPQPAREGYLRCVSNGDVDGPAQFPLSKWLGMLRTDAVKIWLAHPSTMQKMEYYGFADGESGETDGPTNLEGWTALTPNKALPFEQGIVIPAGEQSA